MIGLLEQVKFDMLRDQGINTVEKKEAQYDA
jgi:GTP cyclohydrolase II